MKTETLTFNKDNWSGESAEITFTEFAGNLEFSIYGENFTLRDRFRANDENPNFSWTHYSLYCGNRDTGIKVGKFDREFQWTAEDESGDFTRFGDTMGIAAARMVFNLF